MTKSPNWQEIIDLSNQIHRRTLNQTHTIDLTNLFDFLTKGVAVGDDFSKYEAMRDNGLSDIEIYRQGGEDGLNVIDQIRMLRKVFSLSLEEAKRVIDKTKPVRERFNPVEATHILNESKEAHENYPKETLGTLDDLLRHYLPDLCNQLEMALIRIAELEEALYGTEDAEGR